MTATWSDRRSDVPPGKRPTRIVYVPGSHLDLYWLGSYQTCLDRGAHIIRAYLDRCLEHADETFMIESVVFAAEFIHRHPEYRDHLRTLTREGRVDISATYIDRWENLVLAESIIRNVAIAKRWLADELDHDSRIALHPDLPGLNPQTPQLYRSAGLDFYASARKIFAEGRVWRAVAPDGTDLLMLRWPGHYNFIPLRLADLPVELPRWGDWELDFDAVDERFPLGTLPVSAIAGDLTDPDDFARRYGRPLTELVADYADRLPDVSFGYSTPTRVLTPYRDSNVPVVRVYGGMPSVWGVNADESTDFFRRSRHNEALLLAAETAGVIGRLAGRELLPPDADTWHGVFAEEAFFARKDSIDPSRGLDDLWRLHLFTQDHNGGGQEGALSSFQKRVRQQRLAEYARRTIAHALGLQPADALCVFNPTPTTSGRWLTLDANSAAASVVTAWQLTDQAPAVRREIDPLGRTRLAIHLDQLASVGSRTVTRLGLADAPPAGPPVRVISADHSMALDNGLVRCTVDRSSGQIHIEDLTTGMERTSGAFGALTAVPEIGNDVTLHTDETHVITATVRHVEAVNEQLLVEMRLLDIDWYLLVTVRPGSADVHIEIATRWPGTAGWQIRLALAEADDTDVAFGTPYHLTRWTDVSTLACPAVRDEITVADFHAYREIQHWLQVQRDAQALIIATDTPGVHLANSTLSAVLLRTPQSCGDTRFHWDNHGDQSWSFTFQPAIATDRASDRANALARPPMILAGRAPNTELLQVTGDPLHVGALLCDDADNIQVRLVNMSDHPARSALHGPLVAGAHASFVELDGRSTGQHELSDVEDSNAPGFLTGLPAWRVATLALHDTHARANTSQEGDTA